LILFRRQPARCSVDVQSVWMVTVLPYQQTCLEDGCSQITSCLTMNRCHALLIATDLLYLHLQSSDDVSVMTTCVRLGSMSWSNYV